LGLCLIVDQAGSLYCEKAHRFDLESPYGHHKLDFFDVKFEIGCRTEAVRCFEYIKVFVDAASCAIPEGAIPPISGRL